MPARMKETKLVQTREIEFVKRDFEFRRGITPFVCSTGEDFKIEHEYLSSRVFPELNRLCHERGAYFCPTEIRYSPSDSLVQKGHLLATTFRFIERCAPFFIGLIGDRYGYHRNPELPLLIDDDDGRDWIERNLIAAGKSGHDWVLDENAQYKSITELQCLYAGFKNNIRRNSIYADAEIQCYFYYRQPEHRDRLFTDLPQAERTEKLKVFEPENEYCKLKCQNLKTEIIKKGHVVQYFRDVDHLCQLVLRDWKSIIDEFCPPIYSSLNITERKEKDIYLDWLSHESFAEHKRDNFQWLPEYEELSNALTAWALTAMDDPPQGWDQHPCPTEVVKAIKDGKRQYCDSLYQSILGIVGDRGSGKSSFIAHWVRQFQQDYSFLNVFTHHVESSATSNSVVCMLKRCIAYFSNQLQHNYETIDEDCLRENNLLSVGEVFAASVSHKPCLIILDGLDDLGKLNSHHSKVRDLSWLPYPLPPHVRLIVTTCRSDVSYTVLAKRPDTKLQPMPTIGSKQSQKIVLEHHLSRGVAETIGTEDLDFLYEHCKLIDRPLFLQLIACGAQHNYLYTNSPSPGKDSTRTPKSVNKFENYISSVLEKCSVRDLLNMLVSRWIQAYSWAAVTVTTPKSSFRHEKKGDTIGVNGGWIADVLRFLVVSKHGLHTTEIYDLLDQLGYHGDTRVTHYDLIMFLDVIHGSIVYESPDGLFRFNHQHIKEGVEHALITPVTIDLRREMNSSAVVVPTKSVHKSTQAKRQLDKKIYHTYLADYFISKHHSERRTQELPWQLFSSKDVKRLHQVLSEPRLFLDLMKTLATRLDMCEFWEWLLAAQYDPVSTYTDMMAMQIHDNDVPEISISDLVLPLDASKSHASTHEFDQPSSPLDVHELGKYSAQLLYMFHHYEAALQVSLSAFNKLSQICPLEHAQEQVKCEIQSQIGASYQALDMNKDALRWYDRALDTVTDLLVMPMLPRQQKILKHLKGDILLELATLKIKFSESREAENLLTGARKCMTESDNLIGGAKLLLKLGILKSEARDYCRAHELLHGAQLEYEKWYGKNHHQVADALHQFAALLSNENNTFRIDEEKAEVLFRRAVLLREQAYGKTHLKVADTLFRLGQLLKTSKHDKIKREALGCLQRAYDIHNNKLGPEHPTAKKLYKSMNDLEIDINYTPQFRVEDRNKALPYSTLSWHEHELLELEMRARRKNALKNVCTIRMSMKVISAFKELAKAKANRKGGVRKFGVLFSPKGSHNDDKTNENDNEELDKIQNRLTEALGVLVPAQDGAEHVTSFVSEEDLETIKESEILDLEDRALAANGRAFMNDILPVSEFHATLASDADEYIPRDIKSPVPRYENPKHTVTYGTPVHIPTDRPASKAEMRPASNAEMRPALKAEIRPASASRADSRPLSRSEMRSFSAAKTESRPMQTSSDYFDNYSNVSSAIMNPKSKAEKKVLRPQSAPYKMFQRYQQVEASPRSTSVVPHAKRYISSAPVQNSKGGTVHFARDSAGSHRSRCPAPSAHAFDSVNTYSAINGPNSSTESLLGPRLCPRDRDFRQQHSSAWYHVPGRYVTNDKPYPCKRSQVRIHDAHKKLVTNLHTRGHSKLLLSSTFPTYIGTKQRYFNALHYH